MAVNIFLALFSVVSVIVIAILVGWVAVQCLKMMDDDGGVP